MKKTLLLFASFFLLVDRLLGPGVEQQILQQVKLPKLSTTQKAQQQQNEEVDEVQKKRVLNRDNQFVDQSVPMKRRIYNSEYEQKQIQEAYNKIIQVHKKELDQINSEKKNIQKKLAELQAQNSLAKNHVQKKQIEEAQKALIAKGNFLQKLKNDLQVKQRVAEDKLAKTNEDIARLEQAKDAAIIFAQQSQYHQSPELLEQDIKVLSKEQKDAQNELHIAKQQLKKVLKDEKTLSSELAGLKMDKENLSSELLSAKADLKQVGDDILQNKLVDKNLKQELSEINAELQELTNELDDLDLRLPPNIDPGQPPTPPEIPDPPQPPISDDDLDDSVLPFDDPEPKFDSNLLKEYEVKPFPGGDFDEIPPAEVIDPDLFDQKVPQLKLTHFEKIEPLVLRFQNKFSTLDPIPTLGRVFCDLLNEQIKIQKELAGLAWQNYASIPTIDQVLGVKAIFKSLGNSYNSRESDWNDQRKQQTNPDYKFKFELLDTVKKQFIGNKKKAQSSNDLYPIVLISEFINKLETSRTELATFVGASALLEACTVIADLHKNFLKNHPDNFISLLVELALHFQSDLKSRAGNTVHLQISAENLLKLQDHVMNVLAQMAIRNSGIETNLQEFNPGINSLFIDGTIRSPDLSYEKSLKYFEQIGINFTPKSSWQKIKEVQNTTIAGVKNPLTISNIFENIGLLVAQKLTTKFTNYSELTEIASGKNLFKLAEFLELLDQANQQTKVTFVEPKEPSVKWKFSTDFNMLDQDLIDKINDFCISQNGQKSILEQEWLEVSQQLLADSIKIKKQECADQFVTLQESFNQIKQLLSDFEDSDLTIIFLQKKGLSPVQKKCKQALEFIKEALLDSLELANKTIQANPGCLTDQSFALFQKQSLSAINSLNQVASMIPEFKEKQRAFLQEKKNYDLRNNVYQQYLREYSAWLDRKKKFESAQGFEREEHNLREDLKKEEIDEYNQKIRHHFDKKYSSWVAAKKEYESKVRNNKSKEDLKKMKLASYEEDLLVYATKKLKAQAQYLEQKKAFDDKKVMLARARDEWQQKQDEKISAIKQRRQDLLNEKRSKKEKLQQNRDLILANAQKQKDLALKVDDINKKLFQVLDDAKIVEKKIAEQQKVISTLTKNIAFAELKVKDINRLLKEKELQHQKSILEEEALLQAKETFLNNLARQDPDLDENDLQQLASGNLKEIDAKIAKLKSAQKDVAQEIQSLSADLDKAKSDFSDSLLEYNKNKDLLKKIETKDDLRSDQVPEEEKLLQKLDEEKKSLNVSTKNKLLSLQGKAQLVYQQLRSDPTTSQQTITELERLLENIQKILNTAN